MGSIRMLCVLKGQISSLPRERIVNFGDGVPHIVGFSTNSRMAPHQIGPRSDSSLNVILSYVDPCPPLTVSNKSLVGSCANAA